MRKLLRANGERLLKSRALWLCAAGAFLFSAFFMLNLNAEDPRLDEVFMQVLPFLPIFHAAFASLFLGVEYQDGTMRNKVIVGYSRGKIYLAALIAVIVGCFAILSAWALGSAIFGMLRFGGFASPAGYILLIAIVILMLTAAEAAMLTALSMLLANRAAAAVIAILMMIGLLAAGSSFYNALCEPKMSNGVMMTENGVEFSDPEPNPSYVSGTRREIYAAIVDALPSGQTILLANQELAHPIASLCASAGIVLAVSAVGIAAFRRKDLK